MSHLQPRALGMDSQEFKLINCLLAVRLNLLVPANACWCPIVLWLNLWIAFASHRHRLTASTWLSQKPGLALRAIRSNKRRKSRERALLANAGEFNRRYLTCQISAILYADRGDWRKSQSLHREHLAIFVDRSDRRIKSPRVSLALP